MIVSKFPYEKLTRSHQNGQRFYSGSDGKKLPSVTTILAATKTQKDKQSLQDWKNRVGKDKAAEISLMASSRGTRMHSFLERYIMNGEIGDSGNNPYAIESHKMAAHVVASGLHKVTEFYGSEVGLYYPELYAGTTDCVGLYDGELAIIDFKQSNKPKHERYLDEYRCQLAAYILAHNKVYGTNITHAINMICTPYSQYQQFEVNKSNIDKYTDMWWGKVYQYYENLEYYQQVANN